MQAQIGGSNASAAAARALATLREAQKLTEDQLRDPRVKTEIANATATLALAGERDANAAQTTALTPSMIAENEAKAESSLAQAFKFREDGNQTVALTPSMIAENQAKVENSLADAFAAKALGDQRTELTPSMIAENQAGADEKTSAADLNRAKTDSEGRIILNAGQTIRTTNSNGEVETYTAPETVKVEVEAGEVAVVINPDGTQTRIEGPPGTGDPKDGAAKLEALDQQLSQFFESDDYSRVDKSLLRRIRSNITTASKGKDVEEASINAQSLLSQTYNGSSVFTVRVGTNFTIPAFIAVAAKDSRMTVEKIVNLYGLSKSQATRLLSEVRAQ